MAKPESVLIYVGTYPDEAAARADYQIVMEGIELPGGWETADGSLG